MIINRKNIWSLSWPLIIANFTIPLVGLTDTIIMGHMPDSSYIGDLKCKFLLNLAVSKLLSLSLPLSSPTDIPPLIANLLFRFVL